MEMGRSKKIRGEKEGEEGAGGDGKEKKEAKIRVPRGEDKRGLRQWKGEE